MCRAGEGDDIDGSTMSEDARRFRRVGEVRAVVLDAPCEWTTTSGELLRGDAGDWLITSADGGVRTARDAQFQASYEHVQGSVWRRIGSVTAWQTQSEVDVHTLEGRVTAHRGDWIVRADDGSTWPVTDQVFRATYEAI